MKNRNEKKKHIHKKNHFLTFLVDDKIFFFNINYVWPGLGNLDVSIGEWKLYVDIPVNEGIYYIHLFGCEDFIMHRQTWVWMSTYSGRKIISFYWRTYISVIWLYPSDIYRFNQYSRGRALFSGSTLFQEKWKQRRNEVFLYQNQDLPLQGGFVGRSRITAGNSGESGSFVI